MHWVEAYFTEKYPNTDRVDVKFGTAQDVAVKALKCLLSAPSPLKTPELEIEIVFPIAEGSEARIDKIGDNRFIVCIENGLVNSALEISYGLIADKEFLPSNASSGEYLDFHSKIPLGHKHFFLDQDFDRQSYETWVMACRQDPNEFRSTMLAGLILSFVAIHEAAHVYQGHADWDYHRKQQRLAEGSPEEMNALRIMMEIEADSFSMHHLSSSFFCRMFTSVYNECFKGRRDFYDFLFTSQVFTFWFFSNNDFSEGVRADHEVSNLGGYVHGMIRASEALHKLLKLGLETKDESLQSSAFAFEDRLQVFHDKIPYAKSIGLFLEPSVAEKNDEIARLVRAYAEKFNTIMSPFRRRESLIVDWITNY